MFELLVIGVTVVGKAKGGGWPLPFYFFVHRLTRARAFLPPLAWCRVRRCLALCRVWRGLDLCRVRRCLVLCCVGRGLFPSHVWGLEMCRVRRCLGSCRGPRTHRAGFQSRSPCGRLQSCVFSSLASDQGGCVAVHWGPSFQGNPNHVGPVARNSAPTSSAYCNGVLGFTLTSVSWASSSSLLCHLLIRLLTRV